MNNKNSGSTLYFSQFGGERPIPEQFIAAMDRAEERTKVNKEAVLPPLSDEIIEARFDNRYENTNDKLLVVIKKKKGVIGPLLDFRTGDQGQSIQVASTMFRTADTTFVKADPTVLQDVAVRDLGNGWSIQEVAISGTLVNGVFTPGIFQGIELTTKREDPVPSQFRTGMEAEIVQSIVEGTVAQPVLGTDDIEASERQIAQYKKLLSRLTRDGIALPFSLVSHKTNDKKQDVLVTETYRLVGTKPDITDLQNVETTDLGDGHEVLTTEVIPALFGDESYVKEIVDLIPERFKAGLPTTRTASIVPGTAGLPTLSTGDLMKSERQVTALTKLVELLTRAGVTPGFGFVDHAITTEYGGGVVTILSNINLSGSMVVDQGEGVLSSKVTDLGNGYEVKETVVRVATHWPDRFEAHYDPRLQLMIPSVKRVVAAQATTPGASGGVIIEVKDIDGWREDRIITTQPLSDVDAYKLILYGNNTNVDVPPHLESLNGSVDVGGGVGSYSETGTYALSAAQGYGQVQLHGSAQASASAIPELGWVVRIPRTSNIPCIHVLLYVANGLSRALIIAAVDAALGSPGLADWPDFRPQPITVKGVGAKTNIQVQVSASAHDSITTDYLGEMKFNSRSRSSGEGLSNDSSVMTKIYNIPPTIHDDLTITGQTDWWTTVGGALPIELGGTGVPLYAASAAINTGAGGDQPTKVVTCAARGQLGILSALGHTTGKFDYSGLGLCVHRLVSEPDPEFPRTRVFAEVVNFADIIP
jgi:hypothetical protein